MSEELEVCPHCRYTLIERSAFCPYCGTQLTHPLWKKIGAWILLLLIAYGLIKCHVRMLDGLDGFFTAPVEGKLPSAGEVAKPYS